MTNDGWKIDFDDVTQYNEFCERVAKIVASETSPAVSAASSSG